MGNKTVKPEERVALNLSSNIPPYFFNPNILYASETAAELQELWLHPELKTWSYYVAHDFSYIIVTQEYLKKTNSNLPMQIGNQQLYAVFDGKDQVVIKISNAEETSISILVQSKSNKAPQCLFSAMVRWHLNELPSYPELKEKQIQHVVASIKSFYAERLDEGCHDCRCAPAIHQSRAA